MRSDALSEDGQERRQDEQGKATGGQDHDRTGDPHRVDEALGEDGQCPHGGRNGERAEEHGVSCGLPHGDQCRLDRALPAKLLTKAGHDEQAEVDGETQSESDDQIEGKDRQRQSHDHQTHDAQGDRDGEYRTEQRHGGGP